MWLFKSAPPAQPVESQQPQLPQEQDDYDDDDIPRLVLDPSQEFFRGYNFNKLPQSTTFESLKRVRHSNQNDRINKVFHHFTQEEETSNVPLILSGIGVVGVFVLINQIRKASIAATQSGGSASFLTNLFTRQYYSGGFLPEITKREAGLILGVRETAPQKLVMERYRQLMRTNHPDLGGSPFLTTKINEAKDFLLKSAKKD